MAMCPRRGGSKVCGAVSAADGSVGKLGLHGQMWVFPLVCGRRALPVSRRSGLDRYIPMLWGVTATFSAVVREDL